MKFYVVRYDRRTGQAVLEPFDGDDARARALSRRFEIESDDADNEVVVLSAESEDDLQRTHARYFHSVHDMAGRASKRSWLPSAANAVRQ
jgi:hypothetical protein